MLFSSLWGKEGWCDGRGRQFEMKLCFLSMFNVNSHTTTIQSS
jgi:hypothetical protein